MPKVHVQVHILHTILVTISNKQTLNNSRKNIKLHIFTNDYTHNFSEMLLHILFSLHHYIYTQLENVKFITVCSFLFVAHWHMNVAFYHKDLISVILLVTDSDSMGFALNYLIWWLNTFTKCSEFFKFKTTPSASTKMYCNYHTTYESRKTKIT